MSDIRALSIRPPWSDCITAEGGKRVENRVWSTKWRGLLLIHAARTVDAAALRLPLVTSTLPAGYRPVRGAIVAAADLVEVHADDGACTPWSASGQFHWRLTRVRALPTPVACRGALGLWTPAGELLDAVRAAAPELGDLLGRPR